MSKYISNSELDRFNLFYRPTNEDWLQSYVILDELPPLDQLFAHMDCFYWFIFVRYPGKSVGHWTLLVKHSNTRYEYYDCLGKPTPEILKARINEESTRINMNIDLDVMTRGLMKSDGIACGKFCMHRVMTLPTDLETYNEMMGRIERVMSLDEFIDFSVSFKILQ